MQSAACGLLGDRRVNWPQSLPPRRRGHPATLGRGTLGAYIRRQSSPSNRAASCDPDRRITPSQTGGHLNVLPSSRFQISTRPVPSYTSSFTRSARFERNTKTVPLNGSCCRIDCTIAARPSAPRRKSTGRVATSTRTPPAGSPTERRSCRLQQADDLAEKRQLDARIGAQHSPTNLDFDRRGAGSSTVFRHERYKIGHRNAAIGERAGSHLPAPHVKLIAVQPVAQCDRARYRSRRKALRDNRRFLRRTPAPP